MNSNIPPAQPPDSRPRGYRSSADKRRFALKTGILGVVFFFAQIILGYVAMWALPSGWARPSFKEAHELKTDQAAVWKGAVWFLARRGDDTLELKTTQLGNSEGRPATIASVPLGTSGAWLLPDEDQLWIISPLSFVYSYKDGLVTRCEVKGSRGWLTRPFLYRGRPAALADHGTRHALVVFKDDQWQKKAYLTLKDEDGTVEPDKVEVVVIGDILHVFYCKFYTLYYQQWDPRSLEAESKEWKKIGLPDSSETSFITGRWTSIRMGARPAFFVFLDVPEKNITGYRKGQEDWPSFFVYENDDHIRDMTVYRSEQNEDFILVVEDLLGTVQMIEVSDGVVADKDRYLTGPRLLRPGLGMFVGYTRSVFMSFILALIISALMRKHRTSSYEASGRFVVFASLTRRAIAQIIDAVLLAGPPVLANVFRLRTVGRGDLGMVEVFGSLVLALLWMLAVVLLFSFLEGRYGRTPGKWVAGIRVLSTDLTPCGFGRALIRNLLKFVDGLFNFLVAVLVTALTENWQRVGDLAAGTIVVRTTIDV